MQYLPDEFREVRTIESIWTELDGAVRKPCRLCALESVLRTVLRRGRGKAEEVFLTFSGQSAVEDIGDIGDQPAASIRAQRRVRRLAKDLRLSTTDVPGVGVVAFGRVNAQGAGVLEGSLRTYRLSRGEEIESLRDVIECFWALAGDGRAEDARGSREAWETARLLND
jgi:hypothetical protein